MAPVIHASELLEICCFVKQFHRCCAVLSFNQRSAFVRSYFEGEKTPETASMRTGTKVHRMIEMGLIPAKSLGSVIYVGKKEKEKEIIVGRTELIASLDT
jgi:hypothetical protein